MAVKVIHKISSGFTPDSSRFMTLSPSVVVFPVPGFDTTMVFPFEARIAFCSSDSSNSSVELVMSFKNYDGFKTDHKVADLF